MISIVIPCYNCEKTFTRCLNSIRRQTQQKFEIVLVDDGSTDGTYGLCEAATKEDARIRVIHQANKGLMNAWKSGVCAARGEYIAFCDSDDWIEPDLIENLEKKIENFHVDILLYGMTVEYEDKIVEYVDNQLAEGVFTKEDISQRILPRYFSDGKMESGIMLSSRFTKLFRRELLIRNMDMLDDRISVGEDGLTTFVLVLSAESIYCIKKYYPYHYMRNGESMIGKYDETLFRKYVYLKNEMDRVAEKYQYLYTEQLDAAFLSNVLLCMKKEICRNKAEGYRGVRRRLIKMRENRIFDNIISKCNVSKYEWKSKIFVQLIIKKQYWAVYVMTKLADALGIGKA